MYIASQILVVLGMIIDLSGKVLKNKKYILLFGAIASILYTLSYVFLLSPLPVIANGISFVRTFLYLYFDKKEKSYKWYLTSIILLNAIFITSACLLWNNYLDIVLIISNIILSIGLAFKNTNIVRITLMVNSALWMSYNLALHGYMNFVCDIVGFTLVLGALIYYNKKDKSQARNKTGEKMHEKTTEEFIEFIENDKNLKKLLIKNLKMAKKINPDKDTNPAQSLEELYNFLDWSVKCMPWECLKNLQYSSLYSKIDQATGYFWYIFDQPLKELEKEGYYYPSLQYREPIASWIQKYSKTWGEFLSKEESWNDDYYNLVLQDKSFGLDKGWYGDKNIWKSFNDFFSRKLIDKSQRPVGDADLVCPADSYPKGFYQIDENGNVVGEHLYVKSANIKSVVDLIGRDSLYCEKFANGTLTHTFLDINDYHRYHFPIDGTIKEVRKINGANAGGGVTKWNKKEKRYEYFNELGFQMIETRDCIIVENDKFGLVAILPVGMSQICSCNLEDNVKVGAKVKKGDPLGYFMFGGSDIVMIFTSEVKCESLLDEKQHVLMGQDYAKLTKV